MPPSAATPTVPTTPSATAPDRANDVVTLAAIGIVAYVLSNLLHEGAGHGGACLIAGRTVRAITSTYCDCAAEGVPEWAGRLIPAAGTLVNLIVGLLCYATLRALPTRVLPATLRYFLWVFQCVNLFQAGGYLMVSPFGQFGDWKYVLEGLEPVFAWRLGATLCGVLISFGGLLLAIGRLGAFLGATDREQRPREARPLALIPYFAGCTVICGSSLLNPVGVFLVLISGAASTFFGTSFLLWLPEWARGARPAAEPLRIARSPVWIIAGLAATALCIGVLGPGLHFVTR